MKRRILLIDFDKRSLQGTQTLLEREGFDIAVARTGGEAAQCFAAGGFDLVLLEPMIPGHDGFKLCQAVKRGDFGQVPTVVVASRIYRGQRYRTMAKDHGADCYLERPQQDSLLIAMIHRLLPAEAPSAAASNPALERATLVAPGSTPAEGSKAPPLRTMSRQPEPIPIAAPAVMARSEEDWGGVALASAPEPAVALRAPDFVIDELPAAEEEPSAEVLRLDSLSDSDIEDALSRVLGPSLDAAWSAGPSPSLAADGGFDFGDAPEVADARAAALLDALVPEDRLAGVDLPDDPELIAAAGPTAEIPWNELEREIQPRDPAGWIGSLDTDSEFDAALHRLGIDPPAVRSAPAAAAEPVPEPAREALHGHPVPSVEPALEFDDVFAVEPRGEVAGDLSDDALEPLYVEFTPPAVTPIREQATERVVLPSGLDAMLDRLELPDAADFERADPRLLFDEGPADDPALPELEELDALGAGLARISQSLEAVRPDDRGTGFVSEPSPPEACDPDAIEFEIVPEPAPEPDANAPALEGENVFAHPEHLLDDISAAFDREDPTQAPSLPSPPIPDFRSASLLHDESGRGGLAFAEPSTEPATSPPSFDARRVRQVFSPGASGQGFHSRFSVAPDPKAPEARPEPAPAPRTATPAAGTPSAAAPAALETELDRVFAGLGPAEPAGPEDPGPAFAEPEAPAEEPDVPDGLRGMDAGTAELLSSLEELESSMPEANASFLAGDSSWTATGVGDMGPDFDAQLAAAQPVAPPPLTEEQRSFEEIIFKVQSTEPPPPPAYAADALELEPIAGPQHGGDAPASRGIVVIDSLVGTGPATTGRHRQPAPAPEPPPAPSRPVIGWLLSLFAVTVVVVGIGNGLMSRRAAPAVAESAPVERPVVAPPTKLARTVTAGPITAPVRAVPDVAPKRAPAPPPVEVASRPPRPVPPEPDPPVQAAAVEVAAAQQQPQQPPEQAPHERPQPTAAASREEPATRPAPEPASQPGTVEAVQPTGPFPIARPSELDEPVRLLSSPAPEPTAAAIAAHAGGRVYLNVLVGADGHVKEAKVMIEPGYGLGEAAQRAVLGWQYASPRRNGQPVRVWKGELVEFRLPGVDAP